MAKKKAKSAAPKTSARAKVTARAKPASKVKSTARASGKASAKVAVKAKTKAKVKVARASKPSNPLRAEKARLERNKKLVLAFYDKVINQKDFEGARKSMGETYTQHNPTAADGPEGLRAWLDEFRQSFPNLRATFKRVIAEGDYVVLHVLGEGGPGPTGKAAVVDIFRVDNGKVVEHWDVIQDIPESVKNANSMF